MALAGKESKIHASIEERTKWEQILAAVRSVKGPSPILEGQPVLVHC